MLLTHQQVAAIEHSGNLVITACPGSGKTTVIKEKIRSITQSLPSYRGVIAITFTVKASRELSERCKKDGHDIKRSFIGTIDSFCLHELIQPFLGRIWGGKPSEFQIVKSLDDEQAGVLTHNYKSPTLADIYNDHGFRHLYDNKILWMPSFSALALLVLTESLAAKRYIQSKFTHIFIDEYQDSSNPQHVLFIKLVELGLIGCSVGDTNQSIYGFRGSSPEYLLQLTEMTDKFETFTIDLNHRSHPSIINYASRLLFPTCNLLTHDVDDFRVYRRLLNGNATDAAREATSWLLDDFIRQYIHKNSDVAFLCKKEKTLKLIADGLGVPYRLYIDTPLDDISTPTSDLFSDLLAYRFKSIQTAQEIIDKHFSSPKPIHTSKMANLRGEIQSLRTSDDPREIIRLCCHFADKLSLEQLHDEHVAVENILNNKKMISLYKPIDANEVQLMTLHKSKGLEFKVVFHFDLEEWSFPHREYTGDWDDPPSYPDLVQETNLHYVGITRGEELCILIQTRLRQNAQGNFSQSRPSYFLQLPQLDGLYR